MKPMHTYQTHEILAQEYHSEKEKISIRITHTSRTNHIIRIIITHTTSSTIIKGTK